MQNSKTYAQRYDQCLTAFNTNSGSSFHPHCGSVCLIKRESLKRQIEIRTMAAMHENSRSPAATASARRSPGKSRSSRSADRWRRPTRASSPSFTQRPKSLAEPTWTAPLRVQKSMHRSISSAIPVPRIQDHDTSRALPLLCDLRDLLFNPFCLWQRSFRRRSGERPCLNRRSRRSQRTSGGLGSHSPGSL